MKHTDKEFLTLVAPVIYATWQAIGHDAISGCQEAGERLTNSIAIETCIDADRMTMYGGKDGKAADEAVHQACVLAGYSAVHRYLTRKISLA